VIEQLTAAINAHPDLRRILAEIEELHRVVFHTDENADWSQGRHSAEQILVAEIVTRYHGRADGLVDTLRAIEAAGTRRDAAISNVATRIHSYYTTPLGVVIRQDLFGDQTVLCLPDAYDWKDRQKGR
jgi:hypothetical protein